MKSLVVTTARLDLIAATSASSRADVDDPESFSRVLGISIPVDWPPAEFIDAREIFARSLERNPTLTGWLHWYWILREDRVLIGSGGFGGTPDQNGKVEIGFSIVDSYHGKGLATEAVKALLEWIEEQQGVRRLVAATITTNNASRRVLRKCGFRLLGPADDPGTIEYEYLVGTGDRYGTV